MARRKKGRLPEHQSSVEQDPKPNTKRARTNSIPQPESSTNITPKRAPRKLLDMPFDVLFEIFMHLGPSELFCLFRLSKAMREILMDSSTRCLWTRFIVEARLPECPPDMTEPEYVRLAFVPNCHFCDVGDVDTVAWHCRVRVCRRCVDKHFYNESQISYLTRNPPYDAIPWADLHRKPGYYHSSWFLKRDVWKFNDQMSEFSRREFSGQSVNREDYFKKWRKLSIDQFEFAKLCCKALPRVKSDRSYAPELLNHERQTSMRFVSMYL